MAPFSYRIIGCSSRSDSDSGKDRSSKEAPSARTVTPTPATTDRALTVPRAALPPRLAPQPPRHGREPEPPILSSAWSSSTEESGDGKCACGWPTTARASSSIDGALIAATITAAGATAATVAVWRDKAVAAVAPARAVPALALAPASVPAPMPPATPVRAPAGVGPCSYHASDIFKPLPRLPPKARAPRESEGAVRPLIRAIPPSQIPHPWNSDVSAWKIVPKRKPVPAPPLPRPLSAPHSYNGNCSLNDSGSDLHFPGAFDHPRDHSSPADRGCQGVSAEHLNPGYH